MGFNLMAALGGAGRAASENMAERQLQMDKLELMDAEAATRERLTRSAERRAKRKEQQENVDFLMTIGYDRAAAAQIAKGGDKAVLDAGTKAQKAGEHGVDVSTLYSMSSSFDDMDETLTGASPVPAGPMGFNWNADAIKTIYGEPDEEVQSLSVMLDANSKQQISLLNTGSVTDGPIKAKMDKLVAEEKKILQQMQKKAQAQAVQKPVTPDTFEGIKTVADATSFESNLTKIKQQAMLGMGFRVNFEDALEAQFEGEVGKGYVSLYGAVTQAYEAWQIGKDDPYIMDRIGSELREAKSYVKNYGKRQYNAGDIVKEYALNEAPDSGELKVGDTYTAMMKDKQGNTRKAIYVYMGFDYQEAMLVGLE
jgi:hypothetical protein